MENNIITQESAISAFKDMPNTVLITLYSISKYHEKYNFTSWVLAELETRGFKKDSLVDIDYHFSEFYNMLINQDGL